MYVCSCLLHALLDMLLSVHTPTNGIVVHSRSESRCSRASVDTIDDVQQHFDLAIAAGERQLRSEQGLSVCNTSL